MAKKKTNKTLKQSDTEEQFSNVLPQNIALMGERVDEDKNIYISQKVYKEIHKFTQDKTTNESGGMLIGTVIEEFGKQNIVINGFIEAKCSEGTPTTLKFTHETWDYVHKEIAKKYTNQKIVGWIHTHPDFGIFLSEYDKFIQENFFKDENQIAYVVDPIQNIEGFYFWINEKIERCKGFYVFDKTSVKITVTSDIDESMEDDKNKNKSGCVDGSIDGYRDLRRRGQSSAGGTGVPLTVFDFLFFHLSRYIPAYHLGYIGVADPFPSVSSGQHRAAAHKD